MKTTADTQRIPILTGEESGLHTSQRVSIQTSNSTMKEKKGNKNLFWVSMVPAKSSVTWCLPKIV
jgi:hypothetical protein